MVLNTEYSNEADNMDTISSNHYNHTLDMKKWGEGEKNIYQQNLVAQPNNVCLHFIGQNYVIWSAYMRGRLRMQYFQLSTLPPSTSPKKEEESDTGYSKF